MLRNHVAAPPRLPIAISALLLMASVTAAGAELLRAGQPFPAWKMTDHTGAAVSSRDLAGKTYLLWFYPRAMTPGCTAEGNALRDEYEAFRQRGVEIFGVSFDTPAANAEFVRSQGFPFRLLSDSDRALAVQVGAADSTGATAARRISYLVGADGAVLHAYPSVDPGGHAARVLQDLAATP